MIQMRMRREHVRYPLARDRLLQRFEMRIDHRPRIDHRHFTIANNVDARSQIGERPRILGNHPSDARRYARDFAILELQVANERDAGHVYFAPSCFSIPPMGARL